MLKKALTLSSIVLATTLTGCSSFMSGIGQSGWLNDGNQMSSDVKDQTTRKNGIKSVMPTAPLPYRPIPWRCV